MSHHEPQTIGSILKAQFPEPWVEKVRRELLYEDIFRLYAVLKLPKKDAKHWYSNVFDNLLEYDLQLLESQRDGLMAQCVREDVPRHIILGL